MELTTTVSGNSEEHKVKAVFIIAQVIYTPVAGDLTKQTAKGLTTQKKEELIWVIGTMISSMDKAERHGQMDQSSKVIMQMGVSAELASMTGPIMDALLLEIGLITISKESDNNLGKTVNSTKESSKQI
jgi:hypothetical protein